MEKKKRILRELKLMQHFKHEHIMHIIDVIVPSIHERDTFQSVYYVMPYYKRNLANIIENS